MKAILILATILLTACSGYRSDENRFNDERPLGAFATVGNVTAGGIITPSDNIQPVIIGTKEIRPDTYLYAGITHQPAERFTTTSDFLFADVIGSKYDDQVRARDQVYRTGINAEESTTIGVGVTFRF